MKISSIDGNFERFQIYCPSLLSSNYNATVFAQNSFQNCLNSVAIMEDPKNHLYRFSLMSNNPIFNNFEETIFSILARYTGKLTINVGMVYIAISKKNKEFYTCEHPLQTFNSREENRSLFDDVSNFFQYVFCDCIDNNYESFNKNIRDKFHFSTPPCISIEYIAAITFRFSPLLQSNFIPWVTVTSIPSPLLIFSKNPFIEKFELSPVQYRERYAKFAQRIFHNRLRTLYNRSNPFCHIFRFSLTSDLFHSNKFEILNEKIQQIFEAYQYLVRITISLTHILSHFFYFETQESFLVELFPDSFPFNASLLIEDFLLAEFLHGNHNLYNNFFDNLKYKNHRSAPKDNLLTAAITLKIFPISPTDESFSVRFRQRPTEENILRRFL